MSIRPRRAHHQCMVVPLLLITVIALAGCSAPFGSPTPTPTPEAGAVQPLAFPSPPTPLTEGSVGGYVAAYEEVYRHNAILAANSGVKSISVNCEAQSVEATGDSFTVTVGCGFSWEFEDDGSIAIADGVPYEATYRVTPGGLTERVGSTL